MWFVHSCVDRDHFKRTGSIHKPFSMTYSLQKAKSSLWHERRKTDTGQTEKYVPKHAKEKNHIQEIFQKLVQVDSNCVCERIDYLQCILYTISYFMKLVQSCTFISRTAL